MRNSSSMIWIAAFIVTLALPSISSAQVDHLQCHKVKDGQKFKSATVSLTAVNAAFQTGGDCKVKGKAAEYCTVVSKTVVDPGDAPVPVTPPATNAAAGDYLCYKVKCPKGVVADTSVIDQFGARDLTKIKFPGKLCVPVGAATTTTTTTTVPAQLTFGGAVTNETDPALPGQGIDAVWNYAGQIGVAAGNSMCVAIGADHVCTLQEVLFAESRGELASLPDSQQFWVQRLAPIDAGGSSVQPGAGARCNDWTYPTNHIADSEFGVWHNGQTQLYLDANACYTGNPADGCQGTGYEWSAPGMGPGVHSVTGGGNCGGTAPKAILCCMP